MLFDRALGELHTTKMAGASWKLNIVTAIAYAINTAVVYLSGTGIFGHTDPEISLKYQTLVTPANFAFAIWGLIFLSQGVFTVAQLLPKLHNSREVVDGVGVWYTAVCVFQCVWTIAFAKEVILLSLIFMLGIWASLAALCFSLNKLRREHSPAWTQYLLFHLPFLLHFGWISTATLVNANVTLVAYYPSSHKLLLAAAIASVSVVLYAGLHNPLVSPTGADATYTAVLSWALFSVSSELKVPVKSIQEWCPPLVTDAFSEVCLGFAVLLLVSALLHAGARLFPKLTANKVDEPSAPLADN